jgi:hypothetical protein
MRGDFAIDNPDIDCYFVSNDLTVILGHNIAVLIGDFLAVLVGHNVAIELCNYFPKFNCYKYCNNSDVDSFINSNIICLNNCNIVGNDFAIVFGNLNSINVCDVQCF